MKIKTKVAHMNGYGDKFEKAVGDEYEIPDLHAGPLIEAGLADEVTDVPADPAPAAKPAAKAGKASAE